MNRLLRTGNLIESGVWFLFAVLFAIMACRAGGRRRRLHILLAVAFAAFGLSDIIEAHTGAWWSPPWLMLLKAGCIAAFAYSVWAWRQIRK